jgi:DNA replication and repair protein RecF
VRVELAETRACGFRNLATAPVQWAPGTNLVLGANGEGKTNLLESVVVLTNARSFRSSAVRPQVAHGSAAFYLRGVVRREEQQTVLEQSVELAARVRRTLAVDGVPTEAGRYLRICPVVSLSSEDRELVLGPPEVRRAYLDRCVFLLQPRGLESMRTYRKLLRQRNAALASQWPDRHIEPWEEELAELAAEVVGLRQRILAQLAPRVDRLWCALAAPDAPEVTLHYAGDSWADGVEVAQLADGYRAQYRYTRQRDRELGFTRSGPHRHDLRLLADGRAARGVLSSGQIKVLTVALRLALLQVVETSGDGCLPVVIDDVDAELDPQALRRVLSHLGHDRQLIVSSAHDELLQEMLPGAHHLWMHNGHSVPAVTSGVDA